jgi:hypothetical protein
MSFKRMLAAVLFGGFGLIVNAQPNTTNYDAKWRSIDSLIQRKGLTLSALEEVNKLSILARKEKNDPQLIKTLIYRLGLEENRTDSGTLFAITDLEKQLATDGDRQPAGSIMQAILAGLYLDYFRQNRWVIQGRTATTHFVKTDVATWSAFDLMDKIISLYRLSLADENILWKIPVKDYSPVVIKGNSSALRPTLFDLLAHTALDNLKTGELNAGRVDGDTLSGQYQAGLLLQRLIRRHQADQTPDALIDVGIAQIAFDYQWANAGDKEENYMRALSRITDQYGSLPAATDAWYLQAQHYAYHQSTAADGGDSLAGQKAVAICEKVVARADSNTGWYACYNLLQKLRRKTLTISSEKVNIPDKPFRVLVRWQNFSQLYLRLIKVDPDDESMSRTYDSLFWKKLFQKPVLRAWTQALPDAKDYANHRTEIAVGALPAGNYLLVAGTNADWSTREGVYSLQEMAVSRISWINQGDDYFVLNRESGQPLAGATVQVWERPNPNNGKQLQKSATYTTDQRGYFRMGVTDPRRYNSLLLDVSIPGDRYFPKDLFNAYLSEDRNVRQKKKDDRAFLFTDRAIYRPGQTVYFKGIEVSRDSGDRQYTPMKADTVKLFLIDYNRQRVDSLDLTTNEFGSYHGSFRLPENRLNGLFTIEQADKKGTVNFSVEEYKRPKFFVEYDKMKGSYRVGDSIRVTGNAKSYAGNGVNGAKLVYRITRRAHFHYSWMFWRRIMPVSQTEIQHGELLTDGQGKFIISFLALPDKQVSPDIKPEYDYEISADVTDLNGETRSGHTNIVAGYTVIRLSLELPKEDQLPADSLRQVEVGSSNLSGEPVASDVTLALYPLLAPQRLIRERLWDAPDRYVLDEKTFLDSFPHDEYREETKKESWEKGKLIWEHPVSLPASGKADIPLTDVALAPGWYVLEARAVDKYGQPVVDKQYVQLYNGKTGQPGSPQYLWPGEKMITMEPGSRVTTTMGSSETNLFVIRTVERQGKKDLSSFVLNNGRKSSDWTITEADRGGFGVADVFIRDNRIYTHATTVAVPWTNKELSIRYANFRDKTLPGSKEQWKVTIRGSKGEKVSAEALMAMYDASLDAFREQSWAIPYLFGDFDGSPEWGSQQMFTAAHSLGREFGGYRAVYHPRTYDALQQPGNGSAGSIMYRGNRFGTVTLRGEAIPGAAPMIAQMDYASTDDVVVTGFASRKMAKYDANSNARLADEPGDKVDGVKFDEVPAPPPPPNNAPVQARKDFRETAFFFPELHTDTAGNVSFSFTMPEALTSWKWMTLAHTRDLAFGYAERSVISQKELMIQPNAPRFLREGDRMELPVKVSNLTDSEMTGQIHLELTDPTTGQTADGWFVNRQANQYFTVPAHGSISVGFPIDIPFQYNRPLTYKVTGETHSYSDGEEATLPVVSNRMLVTESLPLNMPGDGTKHFSFDKLLKSGSSETLNHHALTVEFTANPAWYAVQALPYLMEYPYECAEQTFNRAYANALATSIVTKTPRLREVFEKWRTTDTAALLSNLQKNQELKSVLLEETPWVLQGKSEEQQKKNIALLFGMDRMSRELGSAIDRLVALQSPDGGFPWFAGGMDDRYITQYILTGIGRLQRLDAIPFALQGKIKKMIAAALPWLDAKVREDYEQLKKKEPVYIGPMIAQYLYMRSMFNDYGIGGNVLPAVSFYRKLAQNNWVPAGKYVQGMIALALFRTGDVQTAKNILASLRQTALRDEEKGMYWKGMETGYYWYQAPIEIQALLIEAFREISGDAAIDRDLKTWLLRQKQTHNWATTKATADACYALLMGGQEWLNAERNVAVSLGDKKIDWVAGSGEAGSGYNKKVFDGPFVNPSMGNITVKMATVGAKPSGPAMTAGGSAAGSPAWGAVYWQYFDMLDRITPPGGNKSALSIEKKLFVSRNTDRGPVLEPVTDNAILKPGDKVVVRVVIRADRDMEYVHMKDMRGACFEPVDVISQYRYQDGLGYYQSTKDASTDFFFGWLPKGTHVFEYSLFTGQSGNFSNGVTSIECMYAPEFSYHCEGIRVNVEAP